MIKPLFFKCYRSISPSQGALRAGTARCLGCRQHTGELGKGPMPVYGSHQNFLGNADLGDLSIVWFQQQEKLEELLKIKHGCEILANFQQALVQGRPWPWHFKERSSFPRSHQGLRTGDLKAENTKLKPLCRSSKASRRFVRDWCLETVGSARGKVLCWLYCPPASFIFCTVLLSAWLLTRADPSGAPCSAHRLAWD